MSDIFYSNVDPVLRDELNARALAGKNSRTGKDFDFMLGKIANVQIVPVKKEFNKREEGTGENKKVVEYVENSTIIEQAIIGGFEVRQGEYLPSGPNGFLSDRPYKIINETKDTTIPSEQSFTNTSKRTGPYITSAEISIGDNSMGMMNTATINITIPNPGRDLNYFESIYLRPGQHVNMIFEHPASAVITRDQEAGGILSDKTLPSLKKLQELDPKIQDNVAKNRYGKLNKVTLDAVIVSFTLNYQPDGSVQTTLSMRGPSQLYTDVSMYIGDTSNESEKTDDEEKKLTNKTFYENLLAKVDKIIKANGGLGKPNAIRIDNDDDRYVVWGKPYAKANSKVHKYITLGFLINEINKLIVPKSFPLIGEQQIICTSKESLCTSILYNELVSINPFDMFIPGALFSFYGPALSTTNVWYLNIETKLPTAKSTSGSDAKILPARFFINMTYIQELLTKLKATSEKEYNLNTFLSTISSMINRNTGGAIDLKLTTHPEDDKSLLFYDRANILPQKETNEENVLPYPIPMFANDPRGSIVRDFQFSGKLPSDASNLAYVLNQDPSDLSESDIAPFLSYMYSAAKTERDAAGNETIRTQITPTQQQEAKQKYKETHEKAKRELDDAKAEYGKAFDSSEKRLALGDKLRKYIQFPTPELNTTYQLKAPVIPFDCSFTIDGINGFKYGDVLQFNGLPKRYTANTVFSVVHVTHTVDNSGQWTTAIRCIMRPNIDLNAQ